MPLFVATVADDYLHGVVAMDAIKSRLTSRLHATLVTRRFLKKIVPVIRLKVFVNISPLSNLSK